MSWHPPQSPPDGVNHGANAFCLTSDAQVVLISNDGARWGWPGGRPEGDETLEQTLHREVLEETCCEVRSARLLGFVRGVCQGGPERGLVLARSIWLAEVEVFPWQPQFEVEHRRLVPLARLREELWMEPGLEPIYSRALAEAGLT